jgi:hypothetical protein
VIFVGIDWAEAPHGACVLDQEGRVLAKGRGARGGVPSLARFSRRASSKRSLTVGLSCPMSLRDGIVTSRRLGFVVAQPQSSAVTSR